MIKIRVWESVLRVFHWLLMALVTVALITSLEADLLQYHLLAGQGILVLLLFRFGWGILGNEYARFADFVRGPKVVIHHIRQLLKGKNPRYLGHNPLAGWVMITMLLTLLVVVLTGFILMGGQERIGVLAGWFTQEDAEAAFPIHEVLAYAILAMAAVHMFGVFLESLHQKENLVASMVHGNKDQRGNLPAEKVPLSRIGRGIFLVVILGFAIFLYGFWPLDYRAQETVNADSKKTSEAFELYREECGSCHFEFPPNLLPQESWVKMMGELEDHFGDDASLDEESTNTLRQFALENAAEFSKSEWPYLIGRSLPAGESPQRFTESKYWKEKHEDIKESTYKRKAIRSKLNCKACHKDAAYGSFENARIEIPKTEK